MKKPTLLSFQIEPTISIYKYRFIKIYTYTKRKALQIIDSKMVQK